jgi:hypothetical protein
MKYSYLLLLSALVSLLACSENEIQPFVGTWQLSEISAINCQIIDDNFSLILDEDGCTNTGIVGICLNQLISLSADGTISGNFSSEIEGLDGLGIDLEDLGFDFDDIFEELSLNGSYMNLEDPNDPNANIFRICDDSDCNDINYSIIGDQLTLENFIMDGNDCAFRLVYTMR